MALDYTTYRSSSSKTSSGTSSTKTSSFTTGTYKLTGNMNVRTGPGTSYAKKKKSELTADGQKHSNANGTLLAGTKVTVSSISVNGSYTWGKIPSGWVCLKEGGTVYANKC